MADAQFNLPDKALFRMDEVVRLTRLDKRVLAFWAKEFDGIKPLRQGNAEPMYPRSCVERILFIKQLLVEERLDKEGVRRRLRESEPQIELPRTQQEKGESGGDTRMALKQIKQGLKEILTILDRGAKI